MGAEPGGAGERARAARVAASRGSRARRGAGSGRGAGADRERAGVAPLPPAAGGRGERGGVAPVLRREPPGGGERGRCAGPRPSTPLRDRRASRFDDVSSAARARGSVRGTARRAPRPRVPPPRTRGCDVGEESAHRGVGLRADSNAVASRAQGVRRAVFRVGESLERALAANRHRRAEAGHRGRHESGRALDHRLGREGAPAFGAGRRRRECRRALRDFRARKRGGSRSRSRSESHRGSQEGLRAPERVRHVPVAGRRGFRRRSGAAERRREEKERARREEDAKDEEEENVRPRTRSRRTSSESRRRLEWDAFFFAGGRRRARETRATRREVRGRYR